MAKRLTSKCKIHIRKIGQREAYFIIVGCLQKGLKKGESYYELPPCIHVGILDFNYLKSPGFYHRILLKDDTTGELYSSKFQFHVIELSKITTTKGKGKKARTL